MDFDTRQRRAVRKITAARDTIIRVAARMQAAGTDTSELTSPLVQIQEALAELALTEREPAGNARAKRRRAKPARKKTGG